MAEHELINQTGKSVGKVDLTDSIFAAEVKKQLFYEVVKSQMAGKRAGTASTKVRSAVRGGGAKPFRQKGTGRARQGTSRSPLLKGGGVVFGPHPRSYSFKVPKKIRRAAVRSALSLKREEGNLVVVDTITLDEIKTRKFIEVANDLKLADALIILPDSNEFIELSARNVMGIKVLRVQGLNLYDILRFEKLVLLKDSLQYIDGVYTA